MLRPLRPIAWHRDHRRPHRVLVDPGTLEAEPGLRRSAVYLAVEARLIAAGAAEALYHLRRLAPAELEILVRQEIDDPRGPGP